MESTILETHRPTALVALTWTLVGLGLLALAIATQQLVLLLAARAAHVFPEPVTAPTDVPLALSAALGIAGLAVGAYSRRRVAVVVAILVALAALVLVAAVAHPIVAVPD